MAELVGGVVGSAIGFAVGGPTGAMWGWSIGSTAGSLLTVAKGPRIGEFAQVSASEGGPRPRPYGRLRLLGGQTVWAGRPREVRKKSSGKGGQSVESSEVRRSYAIGFCEGPITKFLRVWRNNELVYDARPNPTIPWAQSQRWARNVRMYVGSYDQMPCPVVQAEIGADAPAMRGTAYFTVDNDNLTQTAGAVPTYQVEVLRGAARVVTSPPYPVDTVDGSTHGLRINRAAVYGGFVDDINHGLSLLGGELRMQSSEYTDTDGATHAVALVGGELRNQLQTYTARENISHGISIIGGELKVILLDYKSPEPDELTHGMSLLGGELS